MTLAQFVSKYENRGVDFDGAFGFQCVDLYRQYVKEVLKSPQSPPVKAAYEIWDKYLTSVFAKIVKKPNNFPQAGDVVIWSKDIGEYGHVAIALEGDVNSFTSFDQNYPSGSVCRKIRHTYRGVLGWLRPKNTPTPDPIPSVELDPDSQKALDLLKEFKAATPELSGGNLEGAQRAVIGAYTDLQEAKNKVSEKQALVDEVMAQFAGIKDELKIYQENQSKLAEKLGVANNFPAVLAEVTKLIHREDTQNQNQVDFWQVFKKFLRRRKNV